MSNTLSEHERIKKLEKQLPDFELRLAELTEHIEECCAESRQAAKEGKDENVQPRTPLDLGSDQPIRNIREDERQKKQKEDDLGEEISGSGTVIEDRPRLRSVARRDCKFILSQRRTREETVVDPSGLRFRHSSYQYDSKQSVKAQLETILKSGLSEEISNQVTLGNFSASGTASMSAEQVRQAVEQYLNTITVVIVHYIISVDGTLKIRRRLRITDIWVWEGTGCPTPRPSAEAINYAMEGKTIEVGISNQYHYWDMYAPDVGLILKPDDAKKQARDDLYRQLRNTSALPEPPFPEDAPVPLNFD